MLRLGWVFFFCFLDLLILRYLYQARPVQQLGKSGLDFLKLSNMNWLSGDQDNIPPWFYISQMRSYRGSQSAFGPVALHRFTNCSASGHSEAR